MDASVCGCSSISITLSPCPATSSAAEQPATPPPTTTTCSILIVVLSITRLAAQFSNAFGERGNHCLRIADHPEAGDFENFGGRIDVDGDHRFRLRNPGQMMDGAGNPDGNVEIGCDFRATVANLVV